MSSKMAAPFCIPISNECCSPSLASIWCCQCFGFSPNRCCMVSSCCFNLQFPNDIWCWASFICYSSSSHTHASALVRCLFRSFAHMLIRLFIFLLLSFMSSVFDNGYQICLWQIFLPSLWLLFSLSWLIFNFVSSDHNFIVTFILIQSNVEIILLYRAPFSFF